MTDLNGYTAPEFACKCGKTHRAHTKTVLFGQGAEEKLPDACKEIVAEGRVGVVCDKNVRHIAENAERLLVRAGYRTRLFCYPENYESTREQSRKLTEAPEDIRLWVAVGCGSIADTVRYAAACRANPWVLVMTAPTTDAVLYPYCDYIENGVRVTFRADPPLAVIADYQTIESAPKNTVAAGYGTLISKLARAFDFYFDEITSKRFCSELTSEFTENLSAFFDNESCEALSVRICRALIRLGITAQLADETDFCQGGEYLSARCLRLQCKDKRLTGENAAICAFTAYCILGSYLSVPSPDLCIPASLPEFYRYLDKNCALNNISLLNAAKPERKDESDLYVLKEYAADLKDKLSSLFLNANGMAKQFRRLYEDAGYWLGEYCSVRDAFRTVCAAYAAHGDGLLSSLAAGGALGDCLS